MSLSKTQLFQWVKARVVITVRSGKQLMCAPNLTPEDDFLLKSVPQSWGLSPNHCSPFPLFPLNLQYVFLKNIIFCLTHIHTHHWKWISLFTHLKNYVSPHQCWSHPCGHWLNLWDVVIFILPIQYMTCLISRNDACLPLELTSFPQGNSSKQRYDILLWRK
jgi:hypothetical protein